MLNPLPSFSSSGRGRGVGADLAAAIGRAPRPKPCTANLPIAYCAEGLTSQLLLSRVCPMGVITHSPAGDRDAGAIAHHSKPPAIITALPAGGRSSPGAGACTPPGGSLLPPGSPPGPHPANHEPVLQTPKGHAVCADITACTAHLPENCPHLSALSHSLLCRPDLGTYIAHAQLAAAGTVSIYETEHNAAGTTTWT